MKLTKYGLRLDLLTFSSLLSFSGIFFSISGIIGGIVCLHMACKFSNKGDIGISFASDFFYLIGDVLLILTIPYLILWILLKIKTRKKDIPDIEKIGKVYSYMYGGLEIIIAIALILIAIENPVDEMTGKTIGYIIVSAIYLIFTCLKIHGTRVENNKLIGIYLGFCYALFILYIIAIIILIVSASGVFGDRNDNRVEFCLGFY